MRGADWLYSYLNAFYRDEKAPSGWNNLVFPNVAMPHVLWTLQGVNKLVETEYEDREKAEAAAIAAKGLAKPSGCRMASTSSRRWRSNRPARCRRSNTRRSSPTWSIILDYMAEPARNERINIGIVVLIFLGVLFAFAYALKREYWKDIH